MLKATIIRLPETASTNSYTLGLLSQQRPPEGSVFVTGFQTKGRGLDTNSWESERGMNLTFSLLLYPTFTADQQFVLNKAISLGIYDFLKAEMPENKIAVKWPNDIYIGDRKVCGILIQNSVTGNRLDYVVIGIGLNVNQTVFTSNAPNPVSMKMISGKDYNLDELLTKLTASVINRYMQVKPGMKPEIENDYYNSLYRLNEWNKYIVKGSQISACITGTSDYGQLKLTTESGEALICDLKDVKFII